MRIAAIVGASIVVAAGLLAAAVVIAGGDSGVSSTAPTGKQAGGISNPGRSRPSGGVGSTDPNLPTNRTQCSANVYVEERVPGAPYTSCPFAREVARAYRNSGGDSAFTAYSPVTGEAYDMTCEGVETVRCTDGDTAIAYLTPATVPTPPPVEDESPPPNPSNDLGDWPGGSGYTAMLGAFSSEWRARNFQDEALERGLEAGVLHSNNFSSLRPGYWVVFSGDFAESGEAAMRAQEARSMGYSDSYPRLVSP